MTDAREYLRAGDIARLTGARADRPALDCRQILPSVKVRGVRLVPTEAIERLLSPAPLNWEEPEDEISRKQCVSENSGKL